MKVFFDQNLSIAIFIYRSHILYIPLSVVHSVLGNLTKLNNENGFNNLSDAASWAKASVLKLLLSLLLVLGIILTFLILFVPPHLGLWSLLYFLTTLLIYIATSD